MTRKKGRRSKTGKSDGGQEGVGAQSVLQLLQQGPAGPQVMQQRSAGPQAIQQRPAGPQAIQQQCTAPPNVQQQPTGPQPQGTQQPQGVWGSGMQHRPNVPQMAQGPQGMVQRPVGPQQPPPAVSKKQQSRAVAPPAAQPHSTVTQVPRLVAQDGALALLPPPSKAAGGEGTLGRAIKLSANHFSVTMTKKMIYIYDIDVKPSITSEDLLKQVVTQFFEGDERFNNIFPVFDLKKNICTACRIPGLDSKIETKFEFQEMDRETPKLNEFIISLEPKEELEIDFSAADSYCKDFASVDIPLRPIQVLDIALVESLAKSSSKVMLGSSLFSKPVRGTGSLGDLGGGVEVWFGHYQSLRFGRYLIVDATQRAFLKAGKVHEIMAVLYKTDIGQTLAERENGDFHEKIKTFKVTYNRGQHIETVKCNGIKGAADKETIKWDGRLVTVQEYFERQHNMKLLYPNLPCISVEDDQIDKIPVELCTIGEGQECRFLSNYQKSKMAKPFSTAVGCKREIIECVRDLQSAKETWAQGLGITMNQEMIKLEGQVLTTPKVVYGDGESCTIPGDGVWNKKFFEPKPMHSFGSINTTKHGNKIDREIGNFISSLKKAGRELGMLIEEPLFNFSRHPRNLEQLMKAEKKKHPTLQIILLIIDCGEESDIFKRVCNLNLKIPIQIIQQKDITGINGQDPSSMANFCLKLNAKLGGVNCRLQFDNISPRKLQEFIVMGGCITPCNPQGNSEKLSIAAVVGSVDSRSSNYNSEMKVQKSELENIEDMENMVYNLLLQFNKRSGATSAGKPQRIIFYRDGVSEGQFAKVMKLELSAIRKACSKLEPGYKPPVTFIVVQKRHHTRLFPEEIKDEFGAGKNVPPGTMVDSFIVRPNSSDFLLVSKVDQIRPTYYWVLKDENDFLANDIPNLTFLLCYIFTDECRSTAVPAPMYYSHLVASRGGDFPFFNS